MSEDDVFAPAPAAAAQGGGEPVPLGLVECRCCDCAREPGKGICPNAKLVETSSAFLTAWRQAQGRLEPTPGRWVYALDRVHYCRRFIEAAQEAAR